MHAPRRKTFNALNAASLARWILLTVFLAFTGLIYVYLTLQLYHLGDRKKALENELGVCACKTTSPAGRSPRSLHVRPCSVV